MKESVFPKKVKQFPIKLESGFIVSLIVLVLFSFYPALDNEFLYWDDQYYVFENPLILQPTLEHLKMLWYKIISLNYHPLTMTSLWINSFFFGTESATPFIITNILIHLFTTLLVFLFIKKISKGNLWVAFIAALIFGIHPMHVESVVWVSERKDVLYGFFFLLACISYLNFLEKSNRKNYWWSFLFFVLACLSKAMAVAFVPVMLLIDFFQKRNLKSRAIYLEKIPFVIVGLLIGWIAMNVQSGGDFYGWLETTADVTALGNNFDLGWWDKIGVGSFGLFFYLKKFLLPFELAALHSYNSVIGESYFQYFPLFGICFITFLGLCFFKFPKVAFGFGLFLLTILLVLQFIPVGVAIVAERYSYLPYIGLGYLVGKGLFKSSKFITEKGLMVSIILLIIGMTYLTRQQVDVWRNQNKLFSNVVKVYPENPYGREYLAVDFWMQGNLDSAIHHLEYAINHTGYTNSKAFEQLAICYDDKNEPIKALAFYDEAVRLDSTNLTARYHRSLTLLNYDASAALEDLLFCEKSRSKQLQGLIHEPKARCYDALDDFEKAIFHFTKAIELSTTDEETKTILFNRAVMFEKLGQFEKAIQDYQSALNLDSQFVDARNRIQYLKGRL